MTIPTIISIAPNEGFTGGRGLVEIRGTGFRTWTVPAFDGKPTEPATPTMRVAFGGTFGTEVSVVSDTRLFVRAPKSPLPIARPTYGEGVVDVVIENLDEDVEPIAGEVATLVSGYRYKRAGLTLESDYARVTRQLIKEMRLQVIDNVSTGSHPDFDDMPEDLLSVVDVARLPAIVLFGPAIQENRFQSIHGRVYGETGEDFESDAYNAPATDDLVYTLVGISDQKQEALALQSLVRQFFRRNTWLRLARDPEDPDKGFVEYELLQSQVGFSFFAPPDAKSNLRSFSGNFFVSAFQHEALPGMPESDRTARSHWVLPPDVADSPEPPLPVPDPGPAPLASTKDIVRFEFPYGIGVIGNGQITITVPSGTDVTALVPQITHNGAQVVPASGVAQNFSSPVTYTVTAEDGSTKSYVVTVTVAQPQPPQTMKLGTNFWYHTPLSDNWSGESAMVAGINWASAYGAGTNGLAATNIWNTAWLAELIPYTTLRFMDWANINWSQLTSWSQRMLPTDPGNYEAYIDSATPPPAPGVAYEWQIDLCNRTGKDFWLCVPARADTNYWTQLATLVRDKLHPTLRVYVEYSNETWNDTFGQKQYTIDRAIALGMPGMNQWYQGQSFAVYQSLRIFEAFEDVFGPSSMGTRVIRVFAYGGNMDTGRKALRDVYKSATYNPNNVLIDMLAIAPYIGGALNGADPDIAARFRAEVEMILTTDVAEAVADQAEFGIAALGTYEGGQHLLLNSKVWAQNPAVYAEYMNMLDRWSTVFTLFMHYAHTGTWTDVVEQSSWGALDHTGQSLAEAHKYRALLDWATAHP